jgi:hypothetical protein
MGKNSAEYEKWPLWLRELHAWRSDSRRVVVITVPRRVSRELSLLREHMVPCGFSGLLGRRGSERA